MRHLGILLLPLLSLVACQSSTPTDFVPPRPLASAQPSAAPSPTQAPLLPRNTNLDLRFMVEPARSTGHIQTTLDPEGPALGPRSSACRTPLRGSVRVILSTAPSGQQSIRLEDVELHSTSEGRLVYQWSPLIGTIHTTLPAGVLRISNHGNADPCPLGRSGSFQRPGHAFTVDCTGDIEGRGLVLGKAVGTFQSSLDIPVTTPVTVAGSLTRRDGKLMLHIPQAVLRDSFDLDGATLDLVFTGNIIATAPAP